MWVGGGTAARAQTGASSLLEQHLWVPQPVVLFAGSLLVASMARMLQLKIQSVTGWVPIHHPHPFFPVFCVQLK